MPLQSITSLGPGRPSMRLALALAALVVASPAGAGTYTAKSCSYFDLDKGIDVHGSCIMRDTSINGHFAYVLTFRGNVSVTVEYVGSQSGSHSWIINGSPGMGFEINRDNLIGGSTDLKKQIAWKN